jgi:fructose-1,6-bisphosphatase II
MDKIAVGRQARGAIDITKPPTWNLHAVAEALRARVEDLTVIILDRPRHEKLVHEVRKAGARIRLISDGDVSAALATCQPGSGVDLLMGIGGAPEGVLAAAALRCMGGDIQGVLKPRNGDEVDRARKMGIGDIGKVWKIDELAGGDVVFAATGVTDGAFLRGVHFFGGGARTHSVVMRSKSGTVRLLETTHQFERKPNYSWLMDKA